MRKNSQKTLDVQKRRDRKNHVLEKETSYRGFSKLHQHFKKGRNKNGDLVQKNELKLRGGWERELEGDQ